ncbi:MAG TPA: lysophospholipid acyltransferase family protein [Bacteroidales bacterium]|nr:lysophospholipid acyltransferase family protein [Bacteroidales bacterium]HPM12609.1 lysophospholipid acyltransferase family protein [Bacteroidales bacterium]
MILINIIQMILLALWTIFIVYILAPILNYKGAWWITIHLWAPGIALILGSRIIVKGIEHIHPSKHYIFMANHASYFDIACLFATTKRNLHFIAKDELSRNFFTGYMLRKLQIIFIDRTNSQRSATSLKKAVEHIKHGKNVAIFPEGTRTKTGNLGIFRKGGFKLAVQSQTPIIPVAISKSAIAWPRSNFGFRPTTVTVTFGPEISVEHVSEDDTKILVDQVYSFISKSL